MRSANIRGLVYTLVDILYLQSKMLLTKVNNLKAYSDFFETNEKASKHYDFDRYNN